MQLIYSPLLIPTRRKAIVSVILIASLSSANAAEVTSDTARVLSDPTYLPAKRQYVGVTEYINSKDTGDVQNSVGVKQYSFDSSYQVGYQLMAYGITDRLSVGTSGVYVSGDTDYSFVNGTAKSTSGSDSGLAISTTYRVLEQMNFPVSFDLSAVLRTGGAPLTMRAAVGHQAEKFTIQGFFGATHFNGGDYTAQPEAVPAWLDASWRYFAGLQTQTRITDSFSINVSISYSTPTKSVAAIKSGTPYTVKFPDAVGTTLALNYHFVENRLVGKLGYDFDAIGRRRDQYSNTSLNTTVDNHKTSSLFVGLLYSF